MPEPFGPPAEPAGARPRTPRRYVPARGRGHHRDQRGRYRARSVRIRRRHEGLLRASGDRSGAGVRHGLRRYGGAARHSARTTCRWSSPAWRTGRGASTSVCAADPRPRDAGPATGPGSLGQREPQGPLRLRAHVPPAEVLLRLAPDQQPCRAAVHRDDRRPAGEVVGGGHGLLVGARHRHRDEIAGAYVTGQRAIARDDVSGLAVRPTTVAGTGSAVVGRPIGVGKEHGHSARTGASAGSAAYTGLVLTARAVRTGSTTSRSMPRGSVSARRAASASGIAG